MQVVPITATDGDAVKQPPFDLQRLEDLCYWIVERETIRVLKSQGDNKPWTQDPILRDNRFCNVRRMDDKVSQWLLNEWYIPNRDKSSRTQIIAATLARHINWPDTLEYIGYPSKWSCSGVANKLHKLQRTGAKVFTGAYIINGSSTKGASKVDAVCNRVHAVAVMFENMDSWLGRPDMQGMHTKLSQVHGIGSFIAGQITADLRYTPVLDHAPDAMLWAPRGPGSTRGMNRLLGRTPYAAPFKPAAWQEHITRLWRTLYARSDVRRVFDSRKCELMDLQNCLCEFDKFMRMKQGEGRMRNRYQGQ